MSGVSRYGRAGDVRGFYARLGIALPAHATREAPVHCFADPSAHRHDDRAASCSVSLVSGVFNCHGCGARGGAYDAAVALGLKPREAIDLMIDHGLTERRSGRSVGTRPVRRSALRAVSISTSETERLAVDEADIVRWRDRLAADGRFLARLRRERAWDARVLFAHDIGWDGSRVTIPVRRSGALTALLRYAPGSAGRGPKMLAIPGSRHALFPDPSSIPSARTLWLVEGPPDALAALSVGIPAVSVPGTHAWSADWAPQLAGRDVVICLDCDEPGRDAGRRIAADLAGWAHDVQIVDLEPMRRDGYDFTDAVLDGHGLAVTSPLRGRQ